MSRENRILRVYEEVQSMIRDYLNQGTKPTTKQLQSKLYGSSYNPDSRIQQETIYGCIMKGRENVIKLWEAYIQDNGKFNQDLKQIQFYKDKAIQKELGTQDFRDFMFELEHKKFGEDTKAIVESLNEFPAISVLFSQKMKEFSEQGNNFLISSTGKQAAWYIPSWWTWNIREYKLYRRTFIMLKHQLERGRDTKVLLPTNEPLEKVLKGAEKLRILALDEK